MISNVVHFLQERAMKRANVPQKVMMDLRLMLVGVRTH